ncbi:basement membrane-specific heparan sulfate proteoglycan core protein-like [Montipora capricornis]|uniref:basement membrane-specific heparan sulfate proteoglycan core protein-like n=1 Tax=Montipora capricornis TaxID=246305 RepID=UPI0035F11D8B
MGYWFQFVVILTAVSESKPSCLKPHLQEVFFGKNSWLITKLFEGLADSQNNISVGLRLTESDGSMVYIGGARKDIGQTWKSNLDPQRYPYAFTRDGYFVIQNTTREDNGTLLIFNVIGLSKYYSNHPVCIQLVYSTLEVKGSNIIATENETITMYCNGSGNPPPKFMWTKNGNDSVLHQGESYTLRNIQREQSGTKYVCTAENGMETANGYVLVTVLYPPTIESRPDDNETAREGSNVFLQITTNGNPVPNITWTKVGDPGVLNQGEIFYFPKIRMETTGIYKYTVWNGVGEPLNGTVTLTVESCSESETSCQKPHQKKVFLGTNSWPITKLFQSLANSQTNISVELRVQQSDGSVVYIGGAEKDIGQQTWMSNLDPQRNSYAFTHHGYFVIQNITSADNGTLLVFNVVGLSKDNHPVCIQLVYSTLEVKGSDIIATENETITMYCNGSGNPPPKFMWTKNGNDSVLHQGESYTLRNIQREQNGTKYVCTAENGIETANGYVLVIVLYPPTIESRPDDNETAREGSNVFLQIVANGNPVPNVTWTKVGDPGVLNQGGMFYFPKIRMEATGVYKYTVWNGVGEPLRGTVTLTVESYDTRTCTTGNAGGLSTGTAVGLGIFIGLLVSLVIFLVYKGWIPRLCCHCHCLTLANVSHGDHDRVRLEMNRPHAKNRSPSGEEESNFGIENMPVSRAASAL